MKPEATMRRQALLMLACAAVAGATAYAVTTSLPRRFAARAGVSVVSQANDVAPWGRDASVRRRALLALVPDLSIAERVLARFENNLPEDLRTPEALLGCIAADDAAGDLLRVEARTGNPSLSARLADAWAEAFVAKTNAAQAFSADVEVRHGIEAALARAQTRLQASEMAALSPDRATQAAELRAHRDHAQALLSRLARERAELVRDVWARVHRERMKRAERNVCVAEAPRHAVAPPGDGLLEEIRAVLANLGGRKAPEAHRVAPIAQPRVLLPGAAGGPAPIDGVSQMKTADADLAALERQEAERWGPLCARLSVEIGTLTARIASVDAEGARMEEERKAAAEACASLARRLDGARAAEESRAPLVRFALSAVPPARPEGPDPRSTAAAAAALGALVAFALRPRTAVEPAPTPRVFDVLP